MIERKHEDIKNRQRERRFALAYIKVSIIRIKYFLHTDENYSRESAVEDLEQLVHFLEDEEKIIIY